MDPLGRSVRCVEGAKTLGGRAVIFSEPLLAKVLDGILFERVEEGGE